jgi:predicted glycosyltransferase
VRIWIDVENSPQVQYLTPLAGTFRDAGADVILTARDYGSTYALLEARGEPFHPLGASYGRAKWRKAAGLLQRTSLLARFFGGRRRPDAVVHAGRAPALAAWLLRIPSFGLRDYEFVDVTVDRLTHCWILHPRAFDASIFVARGIRPDRLLAYEGLKEDLTFAGLHLAAVERWDAAGVRDDCVRILVRPPAEESHYYSSDSGRVAHALLRYLAAQEHAQVVFSPRYGWQTSYLDDLEWRNDPVVVPDSAPFLSLLKAVDAVVASGGTMAREAAYLGIPAYSIFQGAIGGVDRYLAGLGRLELLSTADDFGRLRIEPRPRAKPLATNPHLSRELVEVVTSRLPPRRRRRRARLGGGRLHA